MVWPDTAGPGMAWERPRPFSGRGLSLCPSAEGYGRLSDQSHVGEFDRQRPGVGPRGRCRARREELVELIAAHDLTVNGVDRPNRVVHGVDPRVLDALVRDDVRVLVPLTPRQRAGLDAVVRAQFRVLDAGEAEGRRDFAEPPRAVGSGRLGVGLPLDAERAHGWCEDG